MVVKTAQEGRPRRGSASLNLVPLVGGIIFCDLKKLLCLDMNISVISKVFGSVKFGFVLF